MAEPEQWADRLSSLRQWLSAEGVAGFLVPRADEHLGEYVPPSAERLAWLTGFTGSAGLAVVLPEEAAVFTDGRYVLQVAAETDPALWSCQHGGETPPWAWLAAHAPGARIGYDPWLIAEDTLRRYEAAGLVMVPLERNPVDAVWTGRPAPPATPAEAHPLRWAGEPSRAKRRAIATALHEAGQAAAIISDPASIAWLLNIRGTDVPFTPFVLAFALLRADGTVELFANPAKFDAEIRAWLGPEVAIRARDALPGVLAGLAGQTVRVDAAGTSVWFAQQLRAAGARVADAPDPCLGPKARKNATEQDGARAAHHRDGVALCRFLHALAIHGPRGDWTEMAAAARLDALRTEAPLYRGESFPAISGAGEHGAIIHYRVSAASDRPIRPGEMYLIDSGGQYPDGTTDVTRTVWTGPSAPPAIIRERFTRVLQGHIAIATAVFPEGVAGPHLDVLARRALWAAGLDYDHGTGHGVGSYLSVHEGPVSLSRAAKVVPLAAGMILSDEPGFYEPGGYGIRLENLLLVQPADLPGARKPFLRFETLTLAPFDRTLLAPALLAPAERAWIDAYHVRVLAEIGPALDPAERGWLSAACAPLESGA